MRVWLHRLVWITQDAWMEPGARETLLPDEEVQCVVHKVGFLATMHAPAAALHAGALLCRTLNGTSPHHMYHCLAALGQWAHSAFAIAVKSTCLHVGVPACCQDYRVPYCVPSEPFVCPVRHTVRVPLLPHRTQAPIPSCIYEPSVCAPWSSVACSYVSLGCTVGPFSCVCWSPHG